MEAWLSMANRIQLSSDGGDRNQEHNGPFTSGEHAWAQLANDSVAIGGGSDEEEQLLEASGDVMLRSDGHGLRNGGGVIFVQEIVGVHTAVIPFDATSIADI